jgi:penicillin-binding protein 1A
VRTGGIEQGGSTLTQQFVKNALEGVGNERTIIRKVREAVVSIALERRVRDEASNDKAGKDRILEDYLNTVYFGELAYGIEAAALEYFGVNARSLTASQGALLAQSLPAPSVRNPRADPVGARMRRDRILGIMLENSLLEQDEFDRSIAAPIKVLPRVNTSFTHPFFTEYARKQIAAAYGEDALLTGGLRVKTTIDSSVQRALEAAVAEVLPRQSGEANADVDAGAVAIDPRTGDILGIYGGRDFASQQLDLATQGRRQNGSTFKPYGFIAALETGMSPDSLIATPRRQTITSENCGGLLGESWSVSGPGGKMPIREALTGSVNTAFQKLSCDLGPDAIIDVAARMGVRNIIDSVPAVGLGGSAFGASVLDQASGFSTIANDGIYCPARSILEVNDASGELLAPFAEVTVVPGMDVRSRVPSADELAARPRGIKERDRGRCFGAIDADIARTTTQALSEVVARTTGLRAQIGRPQAGKTGTTNDEVDAWFVGYTPDIVIAVWVGHTSAENGNMSLRDIEGFGKVAGGTIPALIWKAAAERILENVPATDFPEPGETLRGSRVPAPARARPTPTPTPSSEPSEGPTTDSTDSDQEPTEEPTQDDVPCIIILGNCG